MNELGFQPFGKISRLMRDIIITEKIDGTNGQIHIEPAAAAPVGFPTLAETSGGLLVSAGSRNRYLGLGKEDNHGFATWVKEHSEQLAALGPGRHYGEWWGQGIARKYGLREKRFSLFNVTRWTKTDAAPSCCHVVPVLYNGPFDMERVVWYLGYLERNGSQASPGFMNPEGIIIYHTHSHTSFKRTIKDDDKGKGEK